ncbi:MAG: hypothetical protein RL722_2045 [Pseudomonadota bacterium]|jgi:uncharacterized cofD-like protein
MSQRLNESVVTVGGGSGSYAMLTGLKRVVNHLTAVIAMTDSGGSSRRLMDEFGQPLPLGDLRQALVAMSRSSQLWRNLFRYRFPASPGDAVGGHALGNLILHALQDQRGGDLLAALGDAQELLDAAGEVVPVTLEQTTLCAELADGSVVRGESAIDRPGPRRVQPIRRVFLDPPVPAQRRACKALARADRILIGPGDLYTSIVPCLLVDGVAQAIRACEGEVIYVCNVMTKHGETDGYTAADFVRVIHQHLGRPVDLVLLNTATPPPALLARYAQQAAQPVDPVPEEVRSLGPRIQTGDFMTADALLRHDAEKVMAALWPGVTWAPTSYSSLLG